MGGIVSISEPEVALATTLYNAVGRSRRFKTDALIAATAIRANAGLVTINTDDFMPFAPHGLCLIAAAV